MGFLDFAKKAATSISDPYNVGGAAQEALNLGKQMFKGPQIETKDIDYDQGTKDLMSQAESEANKSTEQLASEAMKGSETAKGMLGVGADEGLGGPSMDASLRALNRRQERQWADSTDKLRGKEEMQAVKTKGALMQQVAQQKAHQDAMRQQNWARRQQVETFKKQARSSAIGSILGGVGAVGGAVAGTLIAPGVGTAAGASLGGSLGSAAGGAM